MAAKEVSRSPASSRKGSLGDEITFCSKALNERAGSYAEKDVWAPGTALPVNKAGAKVRLPRTKPERGEHHVDSGKSLSCPRFQSFLM